MTPSRRFHPVRLVIIGSLLALILLSVFVIIPDWRKIHYRLTGRVNVDGATFHLQPGDNYLTQWILNDGEYEPTETKLTRSILKEGDVFVDVGANIGWYTVHAGKAVGKTGKVIAFEPEPGNLSLLRKNIEANGLTQAEADGRALSKEPGSFKLFLEKDNLGMHSLVMEHGGQRYIDVETMRFDDYWNDRGPIRLVKIDTEGAEGLILEGMAETLKRQKNMDLIIEFAPYRLVKSGYDPEKILANFYALGYKAAMIDEEKRQVVELGTPTVRELNLPKDDSVTNLHFHK
jgi:FkbM family methyltransferase